MRTSIDVGIDLGTTNSAIAVMQQGLPFVIPNNANMSTTPSVVRIDKRGALTVGTKAYVNLEAHPEDTVGEFKRWMGTEQSFTFAGAGRTLRAPELSAEVLKELRGNLQRQLGEPLTSAVITVPASFDLNQCAATEEAAKLAGLEHAPLLQEPIAASLSYGYRMEMDGKHWLVFDFGGGTFDLALVAAQNGRLQVLDHEGDNHLGGKDMDWAIVEQILVPLLAGRYSVASFHRGNPDRRVAMARLKILAEVAKIELSQVESATAVIESFGKPLLDDAGEEIDVELVVQRDQFERAVAPLIARAVALSKTLVSRSAVPVEAALMVGGPTLIPALRKAVGEGLGVRVDTSANALTAVAEGAALYAANQPMPRALVQAAPAVAGAVSIALEYRSVTDSEAALVGGRVPAQVATLEFAAADRSWSSGRLPTGDGKVVTRLPLPRKGPHTFHLLAMSADGTALVTDPAEVTVTRGFTAAAAPLSRSLRVVHEDGGDSRTAVLVNKNTPLPARGTVEFRTTIALEPGGEMEIIRIHVVEGENDRPDRNRALGEILITDQMVSRRVPAGNPLEVTIEVDESRLLTARAYLPLLDQTFPAVINLGADQPDADSLDDGMNAERERLGNLAQYIPAADTRAFHEDLRMMERRVDAARAGDEDQAQAAHANLQEIQKRLDLIEKGQEMPQAIAEAREESEMASTIVMDHGDAGHRGRLQALIRDLDDAVSRQSLTEVRRAGDKLSKLRFEILRDLPSFWVGYFSYLSTEPHRWTDARRAEQMIREGRALLIREDIQGLKGVIVELNNLLPGDERGSAAAYRNVGIAL